MPLPSEREREREKNNCVRVQVVKLATWGVMQALGVCSLLAMTRQHTYGLFQRSDD